MANDDQAAFTALYRRHWESLFVSAVKVIRSKEDAADIVQEIFMALWNRRHELSVKESFTAYLHTSVKYKAIHFIQKNATRRNYMAFIGELTEMSSSYSAEAILQTKQMEEALGAVIGRMPPKMREVFLMSRRESLSHKQIAAQLGISDETVKKHVHHALRLIKETFTETSMTLAFLAFIFFR